MNYPICDIHGINIHDPLYYTKKFLTNEYVIANHLAKHVHLYDNMVWTDYLFFNDLQGDIRSLKEHNTIYYFDQVVRSGPYETTDTIYTFNSNKELLQRSIQGGSDKNTFKEEQFFVESLKQPHTIKRINSFNGIVSKTQEVFLSNTLEYVGGITRFMATNETEQWARQGPSTSRYGIRNGRPPQKIHNRNNKNEQTKTTIAYNEAYQITSYQAFSQKNKTQLLYEAVFCYDNNQALEKITYNRYPPNHAFSTDLSFEYDNRGLLISCTKGGSKQCWQYDEQGNPVYHSQDNVFGQKYFETTFSYTYDHAGNWITRTKSDYRLTQGYKTKFQENDTERVIEYY